MTSIGPYKSEGKEEMKMAGKTKEMTADLEEAAKKDASEVVRAAEMAARAPAKVAEEGDPNMEAQEIFIPMNPASPEDTEITVGLNGKLYKIQRGVKTAVPKAVVEIIQNSQTQAAKAMQYIASVANG